MIVRTPHIADVIDANIDAALTGLRVSMPGRVQAFYPDSQTADVVPLLMVPVERDDGSTQSVALPVLPDVPVMMPQAGGRYIKLPVAQGDVVLLVFSDFSLDTWKAKGGLVDPQGLGPHTLGNAIAIAGLRSPDAPAPTAAIEIQADGTVILDEGSQPLVRGSAYRSAEDSWFSALVTALTAINTALQADTAIAPSVKATVATALTTTLTAAKTAFDAGASSYLSRNLTS